MKRIQSIKSFKIKDEKNPAGETKPRQIWAGHIFKDSEDFLSNRLAIIESALAVESMLSSIISFYFFKKDGERKTEFEEMIVNTSWCSFAEKKRLVIAIMKKKNLIEAKEIQEYDKLLARVMQWRNAFTHGAPHVSVESQEVSIHYFRDGSTQELLSDEFLFKVEKILNDAFDFTMSFYAALEAAG